MRAERMPKRANVSAFRSSAMCVMHDLLYRTVSHRCPSPSIQHPCACHRHARPLSRRILLIYGLSLPTFGYGIRHHARPSDDVV